VKNSAVLSVWNASTPCKSINSNLLKRLTKCGIHEWGKAVEVARDWEGWRDCESLILKSLCSRRMTVKVSFHSRSQGSQASQQACVCDAHWYGDMVGTHSAKFGEGLRYSQSSRTCSTFVNTHEIRGVVARYGNKKRGFAMLLYFGGTVSVLLFYVRGSKVWHAQSRNPLEMLVGTSSAHFSYLRNKRGSRWRQLRPEWKLQHRSGNNSQEVATPTCCKACDLLWKLTLT